MKSLARQVTSASVFHSNIGRSVESVSSGIQLCKKRRFFVFQRNVLAEDCQVASKSVHLGLINDKDDLLCNNLPFSFRKNLLMRLNRAERVNIGIKNLTITKREKIRSST